MTSIAPQDDLVPLNDTQAPEAEGKKDIPTDATELALDPTMGPAPTIVPPTSQGDREEEKEEDAPAMEATEGDPTI